MTFVLLLSLVIFFTVLSQARYDGFNNYNWTDKMVDQWDKYADIEILGEKREVICKLMRFPNSISGTIAIRLILEHMGVHESMGKDIFTIEWNRYWSDLKKDKWFDYLEAKFEIGNKETVYLKNLFQISPKTQANEAVRIIFRELNLSRYNTYKAYSSALQSYVKRKNSIWRKAFANDWDNQSKLASQIRIAFEIDPKLKGRVVLNRLFRILKLSPDTDETRFLERLDQYMRQWKNKYSDIHKNPNSTYLCNYTRSRDVVCTDIKAKSPIMTIRPIQAKKEKQICLKEPDSSLFKCQRVDEVYFDKLLERIPKGNQTDAGSFNLNIDQDRYRCQFDLQHGLYSCRCLNNNSSDLAKCLEQSVFLTPPPKWGSPSKQMPNIS